MSAPIKGQCNLPTNFGVADKRYCGARRVFRTLIERTPGNVEVFEYPEGSMSLMQYLESQGLQYDGDLVESFRL